MTKAREKEFAALYQKAHEAGMAAVKAAQVVPMVVGYPSTPFGNDVDYSKPHEVVADGVCGFAWVNVKPGNSPFANWLKKTGKASTDSYYGGVTIWISDFNQSMQKKEAYGQAMAAIFREAGIEKAYMSSRMD